MSKKIKKILNVNNDNNAELLVISVVIYEKAISKAEAICEPTREET